MYIPYPTGCSPGRPCLVGSRAASHPRRGDSIQIGSSIPPLPHSPPPITCRHPLWSCSPVLCVAAQHSSRDAASGFTTLAWWARDGSLTLSHPPPCILPPPVQAAPLAIFAWYVAVQHTSLDAATAFTTLAWVGQIGWSINSLPGAFNAIGMLLPSMKRLARQLDGGLDGDGGGVGEVASGAARGGGARGGAAGAGRRVVPAGTGGDTAGGGMWVAGGGCDATPAAARTDTGRGPGRRHEGLRTPLIPVAAWASSGWRGGCGQGGGSTEGGGDGGGIEGAIGSACGTVRPLCLSQAGAVRSATAPLPATADGLPSGAVPLPPGVVAMLHGAMLCGGSAKPHAAPGNISGAGDGAGAVDANSPLEGIGSADQIGGDGACSANEGAGGGAGAAGSAAVGRTDGEAGAVGERVFAPVSIEVKAGEFMTRSLLHV
jgi:hypothetical protein